MLLKTLVADDSPSSRSSIARGGEITVQSELGVGTVFTVLSLVNGEQ